MARSDWAALLAAAVQLAYRHDTRPFLSCEGAGPPDYCLYIIEKKYLLLLNLFLCASMASIFERITSLGLASHVEMLLNHGSKRA